MKPLDKLPRNMNEGQRRKPIQIAVVPETDDIYEHVVALCDDGSIWELVAEKTWVRQPGR